MNWVLIATLALMAVCVWAGYRRGFLRMAWSLLSWAAVLLLVSLAVPRVHQFIVENTVIRENIQASVRDGIAEAAESAIEDGIEGGAGAAAGDAAWDGAGDAPQEGDVPSSLGAFLPEGAADVLFERAAGAAGDFLEESGVYDRVAGEVADFIVRGITYLISIILAWAAVHIISLALGIVSRIPVLGGANRIAGMAAGGVYGLVIVWVAFFAIALLGASSLGRAAAAQIAESPFLSFLYDNNPLISIALR